MSNKCSVTRKIYTWKDFYIKPFIFNTWYRKLFIQDLFMPYVCKILGHKPYTISYCEDTIACKRCGRFIEDEEV